MTKFSSTVSLLLATVLVSFSAHAKDAAGGEEEVLARIAPVAKVELQAAAKAGGGAKDPATIYKGICSACHETGAAGAPKKGDKAAWAPRLAKGIDALVKSATAGKGAMPPKGGAADLTEAEFKAMVEFISH